MSRMRTAAVAVVAAFTVAVLVTVMWPDSDPPTEVTSPEVSSSPTDEVVPTPSPSPVPSPPPRATRPRTGAKADRLIGPFVAADAAARESPEQPLTLDDVATGDALRDLRTQLDELSASGLRQQGQPRVVGATITRARPGAEPPTARVRACLDFSDVDLLNANGESVKDNDANQRVPVVLVLIRESDTWLVSERTYPGQPTC